jgi:hypothetical protein
LLLNPYSINGQHTCLITNREPVPPPVGLPIDRTNRNFFEELLSSLPITGKALQALFNVFPSNSPQLIDQGITGLKNEDGYTNKSFKVFNIGKANDLPALSAEFAVPYDGNVFIDAVDAVLEVAASAAAAGRIYQCGPIALRLVKGTDFLLSPQYQRNTTMIEIIDVKGTDGDAEMPYRYEEALYRFGGRPHWGQLNHLSVDRVTNMYTALADWKAVRATLDPNGVFDGPLTRRTGL